VLLPPLSLLLQRDASSQRPFKQWMLQPFIQRLSILLPGARSATGLRIAGSNVATLPSATIDPALRLLTAIGYFHHIQPILRASAL
jgi:hypothetical protein